MQKKVVITGAGLGGLSAAIALAASGFQVTLLEKNDQVGGKLNVLKKDGFTFDLGPSILTMPHIFRDLFARAGKSFEDYVPIQPVEPHWRNFFPDGCCFDLSGQSDVLERELAKLDDRSVQEFKQFLAYSKRLGQVIESGYFANGLDNLADVIKHYGVRRSLTDFDAFRSMDQGVRRFISHPKLVDTLNYFIKYVGSSPYDAPAMLNLLPYIQFEYGLWYIQGGMYRLAEGMLKLAEELGVQVRCRSEVVEWVVREDRVAEVVLLNGERIAADIVVSNMEVIPASQKLLKRSPAQIKPLEKFAPSCSGLVMHLGVDRVYPQLAHHNFFYSADAKKHFNAVFHDHTLSDDPTIYLVAPVKSDPGQAPAGCEVIKALPHIPHINPEQPLTEADYQQLRERVLIKLENMGLTDLRQHIVTEETWTPLDIERHYYSHRGSVYGTVSDRWKNLGFKAPQKDRELKNLYTVGGSVNPGGGMPMVTLSGLQVCDKILADPDLGSVT